MSMPSQNPGTARQVIEITRAVLSAAVLGRSALMMATGMPKIQERTTDRMAICAVSGPRRNTISPTLSARKNERPSSPLAMSQSQLPYWMINGSARPSSSM